MDNITVKLVGLKQFSGSWIVTSELFDQQKAAALDEDLLKDF